METWERIVLATTLYDVGRMNEAAHLYPRDFTRKDHQTLWGAMLELYRRNGLSPTSLIETLRSRDELNEVGSDPFGADYIYQLGADVDPGALPEAIFQVQEASMKREIADLGASINLAARNGKSSQELFDLVQRNLVAINRSQVREARRVGEIGKDVLQRIADFRHGQIRTAWEPHLGAIKEKIRFAEPSDFLLLAGLTGTGKSSILRYEALHAAMRGLRVLSFNMENDEIEYNKFAVSALTGIDSIKLKDPRLLSEPEVQRVEQTEKRIDQLPWEVISTGGLSAMDITRLCRKYMLEQKLDLITVDYLQLIANGQDYSETENVMYSSRMLRNLAQELHVPIVCAAQFGRKTTFRNERKPELEDLLYAGERDATVVIGIWQPGMDINEIAAFPENLNNGRVAASPKVVALKLVVLKNRNGPIGECPEIKWNKATNQLDMLEEGWRDSLKPVFVAKPAPKPTPEVKEFRKYRPKPKEARYDPSLRD